MVTELLTSDGKHPTGGRVVGALGVGTVDGEIHVFRATSTILCTGPVHIPYPRAGAGFHGMPVNCTGDGVAAATAPGAQLSKMEFLAGWGVIPAEFYSAPGLEDGRRARGSASPTARAPRSPAATASAASASPAR